MQRVQQYTDRIKPEKRSRDDDTLPSRSNGKKARLMNSSGHENKTNMHVDQYTIKPKHDSAVVCYKFFVTYSRRDKSNTK